MPTLLQLQDIKGLLGDLWDNDGEQLPFFLWPGWGGQDGIGGISPPFNSHQRIFEVIYDTSTP